MLKEQLPRRSTLLTLIFSFMVISLVFPISTYILLPILGVYFLYYLFTYRIEFYINTGIVLLSLVILSYLWGILLTGGIMYELNKSEIKNIIFFIIIIGVIGPLKVEVFNKFVLKTSNLMSVIIPIISLFSLVKFYFLKNDIFLNFLFTRDGTYPPRTSLLTDYNMFSLGLLIGLILIMRNYKNTNNLFMELYYLLSISIVLLTVVLSGSRRAFVVLAFVMLYFIIIVVKKIIKSENKYKASLIMTVFFGLIILLYLYTTQSNLIIKQEFERVFNRYETIANVDQGLSSRSGRWSYAFELISNGTPLQFIFGQGFHYLGEYQIKNELPHEDYPHNFLLSAFLSSGLLGMVLNLILILYTLLKLAFISTRKKLEIHFMYIFILILLFMSISGNVLISSRILPVTIIFILMLEVKKEKSYSRNIQFSKYKNNKKLINVDCGRN